MFRRLPHIRLYGILNENNQSINFLIINAHGCLKIEKKINRGFPSIDVISFKNKQTAILFSHRLLINLRKGIPAILQQYS